MGHVWQASCAVKLVFFGGVQKAPPRYFEPTKSPVWIGLNRGPSLYFFHEIFDPASKRGRRLLKHYDEGRRYDPLIHGLDLETLMEDEDNFLDCEVGVEEDPAHVTRGTVHGDLGEARDPWGSAYWRPFAPRKDHIYDYCHEVVFLVAPHSNSLHVHMKLPCSSLLLTSPRTPQL